MKALIASSLLVLLALLAEAALAADIYVDAAAPPGGNGSEGAPYRTIRQAVSDANARSEASTIRIAKGIYVEDLDITISKDGTRVLGSSVLTRDARQLAMEGSGGCAVADAAIVSPNLTPGTAIPAGKTLLRVEASDVEIAGLVFDGRLQPVIGPTSGQLLRVDGAPLKRLLVGTSVHESCFQNSPVGLSLRMSSGTLSGNYFGDNLVGLSVLAGFEVPGQPELEAAVLLAGNRFTRNLNLGSGVGVVVLPDGLRYAFAVQFKP